MSETTTTEFVKPVTCRRCSGKGYGDWRPMFGRCARCMGAGVVEGDRETLRLAKLRTERQRAAGEILFRGDHGHGDIRDADAATRRQVREERNAAVYGYRVLEDREPERFERAVDAVLAGRLDVFPALIAYGAEHPGYFDPPQ